jgi:hypothetical protein
MRSANLTGKIHPRTGEPLVPLYMRKDGSVVWPALGAAPDDSDPDDPHFTGEEDDDEDDDSEDDDEEESQSRKKKPAKKRANDDEDDEDDEEDARVHRASQQAKRYRLALREEQKKTADLAARLKAIEDDQKSPDEVASRDIADLREKNTTQAEVIRTMTAQLAFFKTSVPGVQWIDATDVFALADRSGLFDDVIDEDGTVDERELRRSLKDLARRKPHLVKKLEDDPKARGRKSTKDTDEDDEDDEDEEPRSRRSAGTMNNKRKGTKGTADRAALAKKFPVLNRL